jgi:hypothetical protein
MVNKSKNMLQYPQGSGIMLKSCISLLLLFSLSMAVEPNENSPRLYEVEKAKVIYTISGGGLLTDELNLSIEGTEHFYMRNWGVQRLWNGEIVEKITGTLQDVHEIKQMIKFDGNQVYEVDFTRKKIIKYPAERSTFMQYDLNQMQKRGEEKIASKVCELWENGHVRVCLYKGIPLLYVKKFLGFSITKKARLILTDVKLSDADFALPPFPIQEQMLLQSGFKITKIHETQSMAKYVCSSNRKIDSRSKEGKKIKEKYLQDLLDRQKQKLPKVLKSMEKARVCFSMADDQKSANRCIESLAQPMNHLIETDKTDIALWTENVKDTLIDKLDTHIQELKKRMPCITRAKRINYLSECMK